MPLRIQVDDRTLTFDESRPLRIGRAADSDVLLPAMSVSRLHAELRPTPDGWLLVDAGGQLGTFVDGQRVTQLLLTGPTTVQCGPVAPGSSITVGVESVAPAPPAVPAAPVPRLSPVPTPTPPYGGGPAAEPVQPGFEPTYILAGPLTGPHPGVVQQRTGPDLLVEVEGQEHRFRHPDHVTIGRLPESSIVVTDPVASRAHLRVDAVPGGWGFTNLSREGTFVADGRRVESESFDDPVTLRLGHPTAGPEVVLVPVLSSAEEQARLAGKRRARLLKRVAAVAGALAVVVVLIVGSIAVLGGGGASPAPQDTMAQLTQDELNTAKSQTVLIYFNTPPDAQGSYIQFHGSGSVLTADGLILTNAHVVAPNAPGLAGQYAAETTPADPPYVTVRMTNPGDGYATDGAVYRAKVVEADGSLDGAVIQIYALEDGTPVDPSSLDLAHYTLGDSNALQTGNALTVLGFPGIAESQSEDLSQSKPEVTVTQGVISTILRGGGQPEIDTDARISQGNSGGSAIDNDGRLIGIPSSTFQDPSSAGYSGRVRPIDNYRALIAKAQSEAN